MNSLIATGQYTRETTNPHYSYLSQRLSDEALKEDANHKPMSQERKFIINFGDWIAEGTVEE